MATGGNTRNRKGSGSRSGGGTRSGGANGNAKANGNRNGKLSSAKLIRLAREQAHELTGRTVEGVLGMRRDDDGGFEVLVEVVELRRVPATTDVLGSYLLTLDESGELVEYRRTRRYHRNQVEED